MTTTNQCRCGKPTHGQICHDCQTTFRYAIANVGAYWTELGTIARKQARYGTNGATKGSIGKTQPLPVDMRFVSGRPDAAHRGASIAPGTQLRWDAWNTVAAWCRTVMENQPQTNGPIHTGPCLDVSCAAIRRRRWPRNTVPSMVNYLARQFGWLVREQWAPAMLDEFLDLERRLVRMIDRPADRWYAGKCSVADDNGECVAELYATVDRGWIDCPGCGIRHDVGERREVLLREAQDILVTATEAAGALLAWTEYDGSEAKLVDRIRKWRDRERLSTRGTIEIGGKDRTLYRLGDVQALMIEAAQQDQQRRIGA